MVVRTESAAATQALGHRLGELLRAGDVVALSGDLGAGKTVFTRGIAAGAGAWGYVASPTFTLIREYEGQVPIYHVDLYRLDDASQLADLGLEEILDRAAIVVIEWAEHAAEMLPSKHLWIALRFVNGDDIREIAFTPRGPRYEQMVAKLA